MGLEYFAGIYFHCLQDKRKVMQYLPPNDCKFTPDHKTSHPRRRKSAWYVVYLIRYVWRKEIASETKVWAGWGHITMVSKFARLNLLPAFVYTEARAQLSGSCEGLLNIIMFWDMTPYSFFPHLSTFYKNLSPFTFTLRLHALPLQFRYIWTRLHGSTFQTLSSSQWPTWESHNHFGWRTFACHPLDYCSCWRTV